MGDSMINISDKRKCSGCKACANACGLDAISFEYDEEGFWYPKVDKSRCVNCGKCERACPFNDAAHGVPEYNSEQTPVFFAAQLKEKSDLFYVSSGGAFQAIAETVICQGGIVYGAAQKEFDHIVHIRASNLEELKRTRKSKYLQSDIGDCYMRAKDDLLSGKTVLFSGTGCQIAGLNCFLARQYDNLFTCEVVCHGVPSQKIWAQYRQEKEEKERKKISELVFRDKSKGWSQNQYKIEYEDGSAEFERSTVQAFHSGYLQGLFYRPSCGTCPFASMPRVADITLADYWKYEGSLKTEDVGVSLVAINNAHGDVLFKKAGVLLNIENTTKESALSSCRHMDEYPAENPNRTAFIKTALSDGYDAAAKKYFKRGRKNYVFRLVNKVRKVLRRI